MELKPIESLFTVCQVADYSQVDLAQPFLFLGKTDQENSLVCPTDRVPANTTRRDDGWRAFRIQGVLDFSLIGILARISAVLAENGVGLFALSTFNTDYILVKEENFSRALTVLEKAGCRIVP